MPINYDQLKTDAVAGKLPEVQQHFLQNVNDPVDPAQLAAVKVAVQAAQRTDAGRAIEAYDHILSILEHSPIPLQYKGGPANRPKLYAFFSSVAARATANRYQREVNERFWRIKKALKPGSPSANLYARIKARPNPADPILLDGIPSRSVVLALVKLIGEEKQFPNIIFQIGNTFLQCVPKPGETQTANLFMNNLSLPGQHYTYGDKSAADVGPRLVQDFCANDPARESLLAEFNNKHMHTIIPFSLDHFNRNLKIKLPGEPPYVPSDAMPQEKADRAIHYLNGYNCLRVIVEISRRLYRMPKGRTSYGDGTPADQSDRLPVAFLQASSSELVKRKTIRLKEVVGYSDVSVYGPTETSETRAGKKYTSGGQACHKGRFGAVTGSSTIRNIAFTLGKADLISTTVRTTIVAAEVPQYDTVDMPGVPQVQPVIFGHNWHKAVLHGHYGGADGAESTDGDYSEDDAVAAIAAGIAGPGK